MGLLDAAESWLTDTLHDHESRTVTYTRGGVSRSVLAIPADTPVGVEQPQTPQARVDWSERWYQIRLANFPAALELPRVGDRITETLGGAAKTFEVLRPDAEPHMKWLDEARTAFQVRTKPVTNG